jgi:multiple antibiotic resistance protein
MEGFDVNEFLKYVGAMIALLDPISAIPLMLALTPGYTPRQRVRVAFVASATVLVTLIAASWLGEEILAFFAISPDLFRVAGGLLVLLIAISMIRPGGGHSEEGLGRPDHDPAIVPLGIPLIAGPGPIATAILFANHPHPTWDNMSAHAAGIIIVTLITLACLLAASQLERILGKVGMRVAIQVMGLILAAIGIEMMVGGLTDHLGWKPAAEAL